MGLDHHWGGLGHRALCGGGQWGSRRLWCRLYFNMGTIRMTRARNGIWWTVAGSWGIGDGELD